MKKQKSSSLSSIRSLKISIPVVSQINLKPVAKKQQKQKNNKIQQNKSQTIKQMYEYKIKNRLANKNNQKLNTQKSHQRSVVQTSEIDLLRRKVSQLQKENFKLKKQNERYNKMIVNHDPNISNAQYIEDSDFKKQIMSKIKNRQKKNIKTQPLEQQNYNYSSSKVVLSDSLNRKMSLKQITKGLPSNNNKFTMNLNMSFVNLDLQNKQQRKQIKKSQQKKHSASKKSFEKYELKQSKKLFKRYKTSTQLQEQDIQNGCNGKLNNMQQVFRYFQKLQIISLKELKDFQVFLNKIFMEFDRLYLKCKEIYTQILQKINPKIYVSSRGSIQSIKTKLSYKSQVGMEDYLMKTTINKISAFFKNDSHLWNIHQKDSCEVKAKQQSRENSKKLDVNGLKSLQSSVCSFDIDVNPQKSRTVSKYHMEKLNENLNIFMNFQNKKEQKKNKKQGKQKKSSNQNLQTYFSKPVSSEISRKVSKNGSLNASLGGDK